jgi:hypothetical protein
MEDENGQTFLWVNGPQRDEMKTPDDISAMVRLKGLGREADRGVAWLFEQRREALASVAATTGECLLSSLCGWTPSSLQVSSSR